MLFSSITFVFFFLPIVLLLYYYHPDLRYKNIILLIFSLLFYAWGEPKFVILMILSIMVNFRIGLLISEQADIKLKRIWLIIAIVFNISLLFVFKYLGFTSRILNFILLHLNLNGVPGVNLILPIGISFYTFQAMSYVIDVYRQSSLVQKNIFKLGLFISFFPQLIAGPIIRYHDINQQIDSRTHSIDKLGTGLLRFIIGLSKKVLIANTLAEVADGIFNMRFGDYSTYYAWVAIIAYSFQIYYDFSGYSDMAIGLGRMFGFSFLENFNFPYAAKSITDFWRRWHISLSNWFKDYVYIPLGGNRLGKVRTSLNLYIVFFITGLWHGASFNFIAWGLGHGTLLFIEKNVFNHIKIQNKVIFEICGRIYTLLSVVFLWVFFRIGLKDSIKFILKMIGFNYSTLLHNSFPQTIEIVNNIELYLLIDMRFYVTIVVALIFSFPWWRRISLNQQTVKLYSAKYLVGIILFILSMSSLANSAYNPFIYFRF